MSKSVKFSDGSEYDGKWIDGKMHGRGKMVWANGRAYDGEWRNGDAHGRGVFTYTLDGKTSMPGLNYSWDAGDKMSCGFKAGARHGSCSYTFFNGEHFECTWVDGHSPEFSARQLAVRNAPDQASSRMRAEGYVAVETKHVAEVAKYTRTFELLEGLGLQAHIPYFM